MMYDTQSKCLTQTKLMISYSWLVEHINDGSLADWIDRRLSLV